MQHFKYLNYIRVQQIKLYVTDKITVGQTEIVTTNTNGQVQIFSSVVVFEN